MKKLLSILFISTLLFSCSTDTEVTETATEDAVLDLPALVKEGKYDDSNLGIYKGVFTTLDGQNRATVLLELDGKTNPVVSFNFPDGDFKSFRAAEGFGERSEGSSTGSLHFKGENFEFDFKVNPDGTDPKVSNVTYMGAKGDIIVVKETSRAAIITKTGTYSCLVCNHPELGTGKTQSFNTIATSQSGMANGAAFDIQATLGSRVYYGTMTQSGCNASRGLTTCSLTGTINANSGPVAVTGTHIYDSSGGVYPDCSDISGDWVYNSTIFGQSSLAFDSDNTDACL